MARINSRFRMRWMNFDFFLKLEFIQAEWIHCENVTNKLVVFYYYNFYIKLGIILFFNLEGR
ncbi:hypothetical protein CPG38_05065 [Malaciobacter marinus]|nr:hypothetical protein CPG38_05065 [Malaciobacter marinus]